MPDLPVESDEFFPGDLVKLKPSADPLWKSGRYRRMCYLAGCSEDNRHAHLDQGDVAIIIVVDNEQAFVLPAQGKCGWIHAGDLEIVSRREVEREAT